MKWKVCGLTDESNVKQIATLQPDFMGFIFYPKSVRYVDPSKVKLMLSTIDKNILTVGVFVNADLSEVLETYQFLDLNFVQLHGDENLTYSKELKKADVRMIKVFHVDDEFDMDVVSAFEGVADYFLFDTAGPQYGGHGKAFDWQKLKLYQGSTPLFLSGGIDLDNVRHIKELDMSGIHAIDVNSRFESSAGIKNIDSLLQLRNKLMS